MLNVTLHGQIGKCCPTQVKAWAFKKNNSDSQWLLWDLNVRK